MGELKDKTVSGIKWNALGRLSTQGTNFLVGIILARLLSPSDYGIIGMVGVFFAIAQTFIDGGFSSALIRKLNCDETDYSTAFYFNVLVALICCFILFLLSPFISDFFDTPILKDIVKVMSINMLIGSLGVVHSTMLSHAINFESQAKINFTTAIFSGVIGLISAYAGLGVWSLVIQNLVGTVTRVSLLFFHTKWVPKAEFSRKSFQYLYNFGFKILAANLLHTFYCNITTLLIGKVYSARDLGFYSRGEAFATFPSSNLTGVLHSVTYPVLSKIQNDDEKLIESYRVMISMTSLVIFFGMTMLAALAKPLIVTLMTNRWLEAVMYLQIFCVAYMFDHICALNVNILYVKGYSNLVLRLEIIKKTISILMILASLRYGVFAICLSRALYTQIAMVINTYYTGKLFGLGYIRQVKDFIKYLICSLLAVVPAVLLTSLDIEPIIQLLVGGASGLILYYLLLKNDPFYKELKCIIIQSLNIGK